jgi:hypothetical protein
LEILETLGLQILRRVLATATLVTMCLERQGQLPWAQAAGYRRDKVELCRDLTYQLDGALYSRNHRRMGGVR